MALACLYDGQISPLFVIEFLHRVLAVFRDYFGTFDENSMKDNFSTVYQVRIACFSLVYEVFKPRNADCDASFGLL